MPPREVRAQEISKTVRSLIMTATTNLNEDVLTAFRDGLDREESPQGKNVFRQLLQNAEIGASEEVSLCQDAGLGVVFIALGQDVHIIGGDLTEAVNEGVRLGYRDGYLRPSVLDPVTREVFPDNSPAILHLEIVAGDKVKIDVLPKGFGGENMSRVKLFPPAAGIDGVKDYVVQRVREAGANTCPPSIVGIGLGGNLEKAALIAKKSLLRKIGERNPDPEIAALEKELLELINRTGIGPQGLGGRITALDVRIETYPTHIGSLPVAVNMQCHSHRHQSAVI